MLLLCLALALATAPSTAFALPATVSAAAAAVSPGATTAGGGLQMSVWPNAGQGGVPRVSTIAGLDNLTWAPSMANTTFSALVLGTFMPPYATAADSGMPVRWDLTCSIQGVSAFLYLDDHLVCQGGNDPATWGGYRPEARVPWAGTPSSTGKSYFLRLRIVHRAGSMAVHQTASFTLLYSPVNDGPPPSPTYIGCHVDMTGGKRDLPFNAGDEPQDDSPAVCGRKCLAYTYFGLQNGDNCFCGNNSPAQGAAPESECNVRGFI